MELKQAMLNDNRGHLRARKADGMFIHGDEMNVLKIEELKKVIFDEAHISSYAMHPGGIKMYHTIQPFCY